MTPSSRSCWLCTRPLGQRVEWHHAVPRQKGGRVVVPLHPICHRTLHAHFTNAELARIGMNRDVLCLHAPVARFLTWIAGKPPDFHAPTHGKGR
ncbi:hypothetical protein NT2_02_01900 [Caenibius tardaugens NBRC 16725]|uniref:HNH endonuclease n=1 Tax=Caenibius tardaugens NBRC 16725 TaxID=1219035 RepID=U3A001_9SPHN|nr:hypothetical protein [Caenibius tardaugens]AZI34601.1 HNH endonuclease [Caenibius tardaugens NBRC 16725]GAD48108.1 hypothetical protein NT2_02_01900 [Caenibius tardaugens NBRC 16725]